jgi:hypothetical protein
MNKTYLLKNRWLLTKIAVGTSLAIALGRKLLKGSQHPKRSTKPADDLTTSAFEMASSKGITFRAARQELQNSMALRVREANPNAKRNRASLFELALNSLKPALSPRAKV